MRMLSLVALLLAAGCESVDEPVNTAGSTDYLIDVSVTGSTLHVDRTQVCVRSRETELACGSQADPTGFHVATSGKIAVKADPGWAYTVIVPANQPASQYCTVTAGGSGVFGSSMPAAVVTCS